MCIRDRGSSSRPGTCSSPGALRASSARGLRPAVPVSYTHLRAHETRHDLVCRLLLEKKKELSDTMTLNVQLVVFCFEVFKCLFSFFFLMIRRPPMSTPLYSSAASDVYKRQLSARFAPRS